MRNKICSLEILRSIAFICVILHHTGIKTLKLGAGGGINFFNNVWIYTNYRIFSRG